ncbi:hypothetical protein OSC52_02980 [Clostridium pasteurianum]|uniref:hypothetical protein n=1 Tax=Clostridium pasteurianum TaxID=1501 RepID=UPI002260E224|nr:hypothetical protein [Clostridium pasteurianum]UZW14826.1 hypothetical protein OSC52_02980 [Clostridium pasteurianum]
MNVLNGSELFNIVNNNFKSFPISKIFIGNSGFMYLSGSIIEGFGNESSDVDLYIIYNEMDKKDIINQIPDFGNTISDECDEFIKYHFEYDGKRFDCELWRIDQVIEIIEELNNIKSLNDSGHHIISTSKLEFLHRLKIGVSIYNSHNFNKIKKSVNFLYLNLYTVLQMMYMQDRILEDVQGALLSKDIGTSFFSAKKLLKYAIHSYLAYFGETNISEKWIYRKLKRYSYNYNNDELLEKYLELQSTEYNELKAEDFVNRVISFCNKLNSNIYRKMESYSRYFPENEILISK